VTRGKLTEAERIELRGLEADAALARHRARKHLAAGRALPADIQNDIAIKRQREAVALLARAAQSRRNLMTETITKPELPFANHRNEVERQIIVLLVEDILAAGYRIAVNDGEETVLPSSNDAARIFAAMSTTDEERLILEPHADNGTQGWIRLIYGNFASVISDYTTNIPETVFARANELADRFGGY